jgi:hypothetical protein
MTEQPSFHDDLTMWTIYQAPKDFPDGFVVRPWTLTRGGGGPVPGMAFTARTLEDARANVPPGLYRQERAPEDDHTIVETWL